MPAARLLQTATLTILVLLTATATAQEPPDGTPVDPGVSESSQVVLCGTDLFGGPGITVEGAKGLALLPVLTQPPRVGDVFYAIALIGAVADSCVGQLAHVEVIPPAGAELAVSASTPIVCAYGDGTTATPVSATEGCPQAADTGLFGAALNRTTRADGLWELPLGVSLTLKVPLRASRPMAGLAGGTPSCGRRPGDAPCRAEQAGDSIQFAVQVLDGQRSPWLVPYNALTVAEGAAPAPATGPGPTPGPGVVEGNSGALLRRAPRSLRIARALRGVPITVGVTADGSTVTAELRARLHGLRRGRLARVTVRRAEAGDLRMRLQPSRPARRALKRTRRVTATLRVTVEPRAGARQVTTTRIVLRR